MATSSNQSTNMGRGSVSPLGGRSNPDQSLRGGGSSGPLIRKPLAEATRGQTPVTPKGKG